MGGCLPPSAYLQRPSSSHFLNRRRVEQRKCGGEGSGGLEQKRKYLSHSSPQLSSPSYFPFSSVPLFLYKFREQRQRRWQIAHYWERRWHLMHHLGSLGLSMNSSETESDSRRGPFMDIAQSLHINPHAWRRGKA